MAKIVKRLTGSQGAGIGVGSTFFILFLGIGVYFLIQHTKRARTLKKTQSATSTEATPSPTNNTTATLTNTTTPDRYNAASAMEMGIAEGNTHQLSTAENAHELDAPDKLHEMGDLAPEYRAEGDIHVEGDIGADVGAAGDEGNIYPQGDNGKYEDEKSAGICVQEDEKRTGSTEPIAELEGDVAFPDRRGEGDVEGPQEEGKEGVGKGFVLTD